MGLGLGSSKNHQTEPMTNSMKDGVKRINSSWSFYRQKLPSPFDYH